MPEAEAAKAKSGINVRACQFGPSKVKKNGRQTWFDKDRVAGTSVHCATLMALCHSTHGELTKPSKNFKGQLCSVRHNVKDNNGCRAVFAEQGTSVSSDVMAEDSQDPKRRCFFFCVLELRTLFLKPTG